MVPSFPDRAGERAQVRPGADDPRAGGRAQGPLHRPGRHLRQDRHAREAHQGAGEPGQLIGFLVLTARVDSQLKQVLYFKLKNLCII